MKTSRTVLASFVIVLAISSLSFAEASSATSRQDRKVEQLLQRYPISAEGRKAEITAGLVAKLSCTCIFAERNSTGTCLKDGLPGTETIERRIDREARTVKVDVGPASQTAVFLGEDRGCTLL